MTEEIAEYRAVPMDGRGRLRAVPEAAGDVFSIRPGLLRFALLMEIKLRRDDRRKPAWEGEDAGHFYAGIVGETEELFEALEAMKDAEWWGDRQKKAVDVVFEAVDVALSAMMVAANHDPTMMKMKRGRSGETND